MIHEIETILKESPFHHFMEQYPPAFPGCQSLHFIGLTLLFGALLIVDLRAMGFFKGFDLLQVHRLVPVALAGFAINLVTGFMMVSFDPHAYFNNPSFLLKMVLILLAGLNALVFEFAVFRRIKAGVAGVEDGAVIKLTSGLSLLLWTGVLIAGRFIPFVTIR